MSFRSEIWIGDINNYKNFLRINQEDYKSIVIYEYDSPHTARYLMFVDFTDARPFWRELTRTAIIAAYQVSSAGGTFTESKFDGCKITRDEEELAKLN